MFYETKKIPAKQAMGHIFVFVGKGFGVVNKAEIDVFLELSCFFNDPANFLLKQRFNAGVLVRSLSSVHSGIRLHPESPPSSTYGS